jgi:plasmid replication initiation protein
MALDLIVKSNALVESSHRLSLTEQRIVLSAITKIRRDVVPDSETWYTVNAADLAKVSGISISRAYHDLADSVESLWQREIVVRGGPGGAEETTKKGRVMKVRWVQAVDYLPEQGAVNLMFTAPIVPYLSALAGQFTQYELQYVAPMKSRFGPRLYELIIQYQKFKQRVISFDDLQEQWGTEYKKANDIKKRVVTPAMNDVNEFSDFTVEANYRKTGRRITHVEFVFKPKEAKKPERYRPTKAEMTAAGRRPDTRGKSLEEVRDMLVTEHKERMSAELQP